MKIIDTILKKAGNLSCEKIPTIAFLGDSVTQGCFEVYTNDFGDVGTVFESENSYHRDLKKILSILYPSVPINIINAGVCGANAENGLSRLENDVISKNPDLTVVCFGLNDCKKGIEGADVYYNTLKEIFKRLVSSGSEVIYMTPNMMNINISCHIKNNVIKKIAQDCMELQNNNILKQYVQLGKKAAEECNVYICDVYDKWEILKNNGVNITELLSNKINHPSRQMNWLFAYSLTETMMKQ